MPDMLRRSASPDGGPAALEVPNVRKGFSWCLLVALVQERRQIDLPALPKRLVTIEARA